MNDKKETRYFSMFTGVGGFELGLSRSNRDVEHNNEEEISRDSDRNQPISEEQQESNNSTDNRNTKDSKDSDRTLLQNGQEQGDTISRDLEEIERDIKSGQQTRQTGSRILREGDGIRNDKESLQFREDISNTSKFKCVGCSEIDKYASELLSKKFPSVKNWGDCTKINPEELPDFDLLCGGFPCQSFSIAGKRKGFEDTRGTMFFEIARILKVKRPKLILLENVKGLLNHNKGETFKVILQTLDELGYRTQWMVLNSKFFGVPQNRERVFIIGSLRGEPRPEILPFKHTNTEFDEQRIIHGTITEAMGRQGSSKEYIRSIEQLNNPTHSNNRIYGEEGISPTITTQGGNRQPKIVASRGRNPMNPSDRVPGHPTEQRLEVNKEGISNNLTSVQKDNMVIMDLYNNKEHSDRSPTLTEPHHNTLRVREGMKIRRLTPTECERLQGFPDGWTDIIMSNGKRMSDTQRYKMCGNAVTTNVVSAIASRLLQSFINDRN